MKIQLTDWLFYYCEDSCTLSSGGVIPAEGSITGIGKSADAWKREYADDTWKKVRVPHDWAVTMPFDKKFSSGTGYLAGGIGWYRTHLIVPDEAYEKRVVINFEGVYKNSQVWCNGYYLGKWANGYTGFSYDITELLDRRQSDVIIAVKVSHQDIADSRWYTGSGITRKVTMEITDPVHLCEESFVLTTLKADENVAEFMVNAEIVCSHYKGHNTDQNKLSFQCSLINGIGETVYYYENTISDQMDKQEFTWMGSVEKPCLWSDKDPALYTVQFTILRDNLALDRVEYKTGFRTIRFDPDYGCFLNGDPILLKGVCLHEDAGCLGNSVPKKAWNRRLAKLKKMGCNAVRMSHNPHSQELYDACDEMGFLVIDELFDEWEGPKNKWSTGHNVYPPIHQGYFEDFHEWYQKDVRSFIRKNRKHPCIIMWSIGNEVDYPNDPYCHPLFELATGNNDANKPEAERIYSVDRPNAERLSYLAALLSKEVKKYDTTRPVTLAAAFPELSSQIGFFDEIDVIGYNYKEMFYEEDHRRFPKQPLIGSENGHEYHQWRAVLDHEYISGQFLWTGIDYLGEAHLWPVHGSGAGHLTLAGFEKSDYYFRQSLWSDVPVIHIVTARSEEISSLHEHAKRHQYHFTDRWNYNTKEMIDVRVFTNHRKISLYLNNRYLADGEFDEEKGWIEFCIPYEAGILEAKTDGSCARLITTGLACNITAEAYSEELQADGMDIAQIEVSLTDCDGNGVLDDSAVLHVTVEGQGELLGLENGDLSDVTEYTASYRRTFMGRLLIYIRAKQKAGTISVRIKGEGLRPAEVILQAKA